MPQPEPLGEPAGGVDVDGAGMADLDPDQTLLPRRLQQPGHLEPAEPELVGDLDLGPAVDVVPARDRCGQHQLGGPLMGPADGPSLLLI